jgi:hypothetical protein
MINPLTYNTTAQLGVAVKLWSCVGDGLFKTLFGHRLS